MGTKVGGMQHIDFWNLVILTNGEAKLLPETSKSDASNRVLEPHCEKNYLGKDPATMDEFFQRKLRWHGPSVGGSLADGRKGT